MTTSHEPAETLPGAWPADFRTLIGQLPPSLQPCKAETRRPERYRGFVLYCMMSNEARALQAVSKAMNRSWNGVKYWKVKHQWDERLEAYEQGGLHEAAPWAAKLYRCWFQKRYGRAEIAVIESKMSIAFDSVEVIPSDRETDLGLGPVATQQARLELDKEHDKRRHVRRQITILDGLIIKSAQAIKSGSLKIKTVGDLASAIKTRNELGVLVGEFEPAAPLGGQQVFESFRVRKAIENGDDPLEARLADAQEVLAFLEGVQAARQIAAEGLHGRISLEAGREPSEVPDDEEEYEEAEEDDEEEAV